MKIQRAVQLTMGDGSLGKYQDGSEAKICEESTPQAHKPNENLQAVQLQESYSASKKRLNESLCAQAMSSIAHFTRLSFLIQRRR
jgi:hypothetical protein